MSDKGERLVPKSLAIPSFTRILLATDFSSSAEAAATFAALLAKYYRAFLVVAHVISVAPQAEGEAQKAQEIDKSQEEARLRNFVAGTPVVECDYETVVGETVVGQGQVWEALAEMIEERHIDLVVVGTRGRSLVGKLLMGSVAQRIFSLAPCPVLSVSPRAHPTLGGLSRILYATDFSASSLKALPYALSLAEVSGARLVLLHAPESTEAISSEIEMGYHQHLSALIPPQHRNLCESDTLVVAGEPSRAILDAAVENNADLIIIGAHAYEGVLSHFQVPVSIAYRVVAQAPCPVLRVRS